jgi:membrane carboxypeptidase/penicillin-binding protein
VESIERNGVTVYRHDPKNSATIASVDRAAFYHLKSMMQGVLARGTARAISGLSPYVAGKTGTSDDENDAWFVGLTNDVTVAVWVGYDNADGKRRTLGGGSTGGHVAVPIFEPVIQAVWANVAPKAVLAPPSAEAKRQLACKSVDPESDEIAKGSGKAITECFRVDAKGKVIDTKYRLVSLEERHAKRDREDDPARNKADTHRRASTPVANPNAWSHDPWRAQQQWGWQWGSGQQWREERREWRSPQPTWSSWR